MCSNSGSVIGLVQDGDCEAEEEVNKVKRGEEENDGSEAAPAPLVIGIFGIGTAADKEQDGDDGSEG